MTFVQCQNFPEKKTYVYAKLTRDDVTVFDDVSISKLRYSKTLLLHFSTLPSSQTFFSRFLNHDVTTNNTGLNTNDFPLLHQENLGDSLNTFTLDKIRTSTTATTNTLNPSLFQSPFIIIIYAVRKWLKLWLNASEKVLQMPQLFFAIFFWQATKKQAFLWSQAFVFTLCDTELSDVFWWEKNESCNTKLLTPDC